MSTPDLDAAVAEGGRTVFALRERLALLRGIRPDSVMGAVEGMRARMAEVRLQAEALLGAVQAFPEAVATQAGTLEAAVGESLGTAATAFDTATTAINEALGSATEAAREMMTSMVNRVNEQAEEIVETAKESAGELLEEARAWADDAGEKAEELLLEAVPGDIEEEAKALQDGLQALEDTGAARVREFTEHLDEVASKVDTLTQLVDAIKPVLEIARQLS